MALTKFHNITGSTGVNVELLAPGDSSTPVSSIVIANTRASNDATVSLFIQNDPVETATSTFFIVKNMSIPFDTSLVLDKNDIPTFNNSVSGFGLYITVGSSDTLDVLIDV
tara:strand:+ start:785 stop:1117 length:333 start_codon:yes stop_codon:yes gene_type:complete